MKLSIIIASFNDADHLRSCTDSLYEKLGNSLQWEAIIVNNDQNQNISKLPLDFSKIKILDSGKNLGFGGAMNLGTKNAQGEFLLFLNPDAKIDSENILNLLDEFQNDDGIGVIGGGIFDEKGAQQEWSAGKELTFFDLIINNLGLSRSKQIWSQSQKAECDWVSGTAFFVKKETFEKVGGFDGDFFMYLEDMDLCKRIRQTGKKIIFYPEFRILHGNGKSYSDKKIQKSQYYDSLENYFKKHGNFLSHLIVKLARNFLVKK